ncbi:hypothetical protein Tco_1415478, partial [Tanacetum coccineum]
NPSEIDALKLMKKMADMYFTWVTKNAVSTFSLSPRQLALWTSQRGDHTSDWLTTVPISGLGQTMNSCSMVFAGDIYGDHAGIIGIKHRHNVVHDTFVNICYRDKPLRPADMLLYSWDEGLDVCVDLTRCSPLTQTGMVVFVLGQAVIDTAQGKRGKYIAKCAAIGYGFLPFSFFSFGELQVDSVTLLKRIRKFSMARDIGTHATVHIFNRICFTIAKGVRVIYVLDGATAEATDTLSTTQSVVDGATDIIDSDCLCLKQGAHKMFDEMSSKGKGFEVYDAYVKESIEVGNKIVENVVVETAKADVEVVNDDKVGDDIKVKTSKSVDSKFMVME